MSMDSSSDDEFVIEPKLEFLDELADVKAEAGLSLPEGASDGTAAQFHWVMNWLKEKKLMKTLDTLLAEYDEVLDKQLAGEISGASTNTQSPSVHISSLDATYDEIHSSGILAIAFHAKQPWIITTDVNKFLAITDFRTGKILNKERENNPFMGSIISLDVNPLHPNIIIIGTMDAKHAVLALQFDEDDPESVEVKTLQSYDVHKKYVVRTKWAPDGVHFATASHDKSILIYKFDSETGKAELLKQTQLLNTIEALEWLSDSKSVVVSQRETAHLTYVELNTWKESEVSVNALGDPHVSFNVLDLKRNNDGTAIIAVTDKNRAIAFKTMQPFQIRNFYGFHADMLSQPRAAFDSRGLLYITSQDNSIVVYDPRNESKIDHLKGHTGIVRGIAYSPEHDMLATCSYDRTVRLWSRK